MIPGITGVASRGLQALFVYVEQANEPAFFQEASRGCKAHAAGTTRNENRFAHVLLRLSVTEGNVI